MTRYYARCYSDTGTDHPRRRAEFSREMSGDETFVGRVADVMAWVDAEDEEDAYLKIMNGRATYIPKWAQEESDQRTLALGSIRETWSPRGLV